MPDTLTANYEFVKPEINGSPDTWGNKLNDDLDALDENLHRVDLLATDAVLRAGSGTDPDNFIRSVLKYQSSVAVGGTDNDLINVAFLKAWIMNASPIGTIIAWGGTVASVPTCWTLCDGRTENGITTYNLVNRFIKGTNAAGVGGAGGTSTHDHGGVVGATTLSLAQIPSHTHGVNDPTHAHSVADPGHAHLYNDGGTGSIQNGAIPPAYTTSAASGDTQRATVVSATYIGIYGAATGISIQYNGGNGSHTHTIAGVNHEPPFLQLAFIMRTKYPWD